MAGIINAMALRQAVMANTPHTATASGSMASFSTDMVGKLRYLVVGIEPVQAGSGDPSPENIRPITGLTGANVVRAGKNLIKAEIKPTATYRDVDYTLNADGSVTMDGTASGYSMCYFEGNFLPAGTYRMSGMEDVGKPGGQNYIRLIALKVPRIDYETSEIGSVLASDYGSGVQFTLAEPACFALRLDVTSGNTVDGTAYPMIQSVEETATAYTPYTGTTLPISWESIAGTVYGATLDVVTGVLTVDRAMVDMGTLTWRMSQQSGLFYTSNIGNAPPSSAQVTTKTLCSIYPVVPQQPTPPDKSLYISYPSGLIYVRNEDYSDNSSFASAMSGVQLVYQLATPQTYQLPPTMVKSLIGTNHVWADTADVESLTYWTH